MCALCVFYVCFLCALCVLCVLVFALCILGTSPLARRLERVAAEWARLLHDMEHFVSGSCRAKCHDASWIQRQWHSHKQSDCEQMNFTGTAGVFVPDIATSNDS